MNKNHLTVDGLLNHPKMKDRVTSIHIDKISQSLIRSDQMKGDPFYIRILSGMGAWVAALFIIVFLFATHMINEKEGSIICGILFLITAITFSRKSGTLFFRQFALALVFAGHILVLSGVFLLFYRHSYDANWITGILVTHGILCLVVYPLYAGSIYRFISPVMFFVLSVCWIFKEHRFEFIHGLIALETLMAGGLLFKKRLSSLWTPLLYACITALPTTFLFLNINRIDIWWRMFDIHVNEPMWPSSLLLSLCLIVLFTRLSGRWSSINKPWMILAAVSTALLGMFTTPGILAGIGILVAGYARGDRIMMGMAYAFLPCFLVVFYYALHVDLAYKAWIIGGSGLLLLIIRYLTEYVRPREVKP